jgi:hypothetical protein
MNKLISLSSEGKFSIIDTVLSKLKIQEEEVKENFEVISDQKVSSTIEIIPELDEEACIEEIKTLEP